MALRTQVTDADADAPRQLRWGGWHLSVLRAAIISEGGAWAEAFDPGWTFRSEHRFVDESDGEVFELHPGDTFAWWWDR